MYLRSTTSRFVLGLILALITLAFAASFASFLKQTSSTNHDVITCIGAQAKSGIIQRNDETVSGARDLLIRRMLEGIKQKNVNCALLYRFLYSRNYLPNADVGTLLEADRVVLEAIDHQTMQELDAERDAMQKKREEMEKEREKEIHV